LRIRLAEPVGVWFGQDQVTFAGRQAELTTLLLAVAGETGIDVGALADQLWPSPDPGKLANRVRTLLWQVRRGLGADAWRLVREGDRLVLDCRNATLTWPEDGDEMLTAWPHISAATRAWLQEHVLG
jgi:DNA-binding SARP family transcriptional activator